MLANLILAAGTALVPAVREFESGDGSCAVTSRVSYTTADWPDFDRVGQCLKESVVRRTDATLPPEGYALRVSPGRIEIASSDGAGAFYAEQTLRQLATLTSSNAIALPCCRIRDWPQYGWRGMLVDEARHFLGKDVLRRVLDNMAAHKLNVLHWHLTDDQGWRLDIPGHPEIVQYGAVRPESVRFGANASTTPPAYRLHYETDGQRYGPYFYTAEDVAEILAYAKARHIRVVPEIELPGHARALLASHPEFACRGTELKREPRVWWQVEKDVICIGNDGAMRLYEEIFDAVCGMFPEAPLIHFGGDECPRERWKTCPKCQSRLKAIGGKGEGALQAWMSTRMSAYLAGKGRRAAAWDEVLSGSIPTSTVITTWEVPDTSLSDGDYRYVSPMEALRIGFDVVRVPLDFCYFSLPQGLPHDPYPYYSPRHPGLNLRKAYSFDPAAGVPSDAKGRILGGQCALWGESIWNVFDLEWKTWPRACATAEVLWLGDAKPGWEDFRRRMEVHRLRLLDAKINCAPLE